MSHFYPYPFRMIKNKLSLTLELIKIDDQWAWHIVHREGNLFRAIETIYPLPNKEAIERTISLFLKTERWDLDEIHKFGKIACEDILPEELISTLQQYSTGEILFFVPSQAADLPFEFFYIPNKGFLSLNFQIGTCVYIKKRMGFQQRRNGNSLRKNEKFLIISNPDEDKKVIHHESKKVRDFVKNKNYETYLIATSSKDKLTEVLRRVSIVHFSTKAADNGDQNESGLKIGKGIIFNNQDIERLKDSRRVPWLIFVNSCEAGNFGGSNKISGIAGSFLRAGVNNCIAPVLKVNSQESLEFALRFYKNLFRMKFPAKALFYTRKKMATLYPNSITPLLYRFFGDPRKSSKLNQRIHQLLVLCTITTALLGPFTYNLLRKPHLIKQEYKKICIYTSFATNEEEFYKKLIRVFCEKYKIKIDVINLNADTLINYLNKDRVVDLAHIDITKINDINLKEKLHDLSKYKALVPQNIHPTMLEHIKEVEKNQRINTRHLIPFRNNVKLFVVSKDGFYNTFKDSLFEKDLSILDTLIYWTKKTSNSQGTPIFVLPGLGDDAPLFLVEFIRSAGGEPMDLHNPNTKSALYLLRSIWPYIIPGDYKKAIGLIIGEKAIAGLSWSFMYCDFKARIDKYQFFPGLKLNKTSNILGGECIAIPKSTSNLEYSLKLIRFLMSDTIQKELTTKFGWPPMIMGLDTAKYADINHFFPAVKEALRLAKPVPVEWNINIKKSFSDLFEQITTTPNDIDSLVITFQHKIDSLKSPRF